MLRDASQRAFFETLEENEIPFEFWKAENRAVLTDLGSEVWFRSLDNPERLRGTNLAWFGVDELTYADEAAWLRLMGRLRHPEAKELVGFATWTPKGFDWVYRYFIGPEKKSGYEAVLARPRENTYLPSDFYDELARSYDPKFFEQEVLGSYLSITGGRVYYGFERSANLASLTYKPGLQLCWSLDFNINPMSSVICQVSDISSRDEVVLGRKRYAVDVLDEISLPNSNTPEACNEFAERVRKWTRGNTVSVHIYGDPAGSARDTTSHTSASDWQVIKDFFARNTDIRASFKVPSAHPAVKDRVNAMNGLLCNSVGSRHLRVDPRCKALIRDLEQVIWKSDSAGNMTAQMDKSDSGLTHMSDALGYLVNEVAGIGQSGGPRSKYIG